MVEALRKVGMFRIKWCLPLIIPINPGKFPHTYCVISEEATSVCRSLEDFVNSDFEIHTLAMNSITVTSWLHSVHNGSSHVTSTTNPLCVIACRPLPQASSLSRSLPPPAFRSPAASLVTVPNNGGVYTLNSNLRTQSVPPIMRGYNPSACGNTVVLFKELLAFHRAGQGSSARLFR